LLKINPPKGDKLNDRPRKLLKYKTPYEVFYEYSNK